MISDNLTLGSKNVKSFSSGAIAESKLEKGLLYYGTDRVILTSKNDGKSWEENSKNIANAYIRSIHPSYFRKQRVYMAMTGINYDDLNNYLYTSENYGKDWKRMKGT